MSLYQKKKKKIINLKNKNSQYRIAEEKKNAGNDQYKAQNYQYALRLYSDAIALCPETAAFYGNRAACYIMLGDYKSALQDSRYAVQLDGSFEKGYVRIAKCCLALGDAIGTNQALKKLQEISPNCTSIAIETQNCKQLRQQEEKANTYYGQGDYRRCVYHLDSALKISPACIKFKLLKAECLVLLGRIDQANDLAVTCMKADSVNAEAVYVRGLCLYYNDNLDKGLQHFERALQLDPDSSKARLMRVKAKQLRDKKEKGNELFKTGKFEDANGAYTEALAIDELNKEINSKLYCNRALVNSKLGKLSDAIRDCTFALVANTNNIKALLLRAKCHNDMENYEEAVNDYDNAHKMDKSPTTKQYLKDAKLALKKSKRKDYYKILGIDKNANETEIKKAYRKRALVHHPDRHASATEEVKREEEKKFKEVGEAYAVLSDQTKKVRYDNGQDLDELEMGKN